MIVSEKPLIDLWKIIKLSDMSDFFLIELQLEKQTSFSLKESP